MSGMASEPLHASCVALDGKAVLIVGRSGSGKSDLALRLIDRGARLVSDDYTRLDRQDGMLVASPPAALAGKIEVHGVGIVAMPHLEGAPVALLIDLNEPPIRMPERGVTRLIAGVEIPALALAGLEPSAPVKVELALREVMAS